MPWNLAYGQGFGSDRTCGSTDSTEQRDGWTERTIPWDLDHAAPYKAKAIDEAYEQQAKEDQGKVKQLIAQIVSETR